MEELFDKLMEENMHKFQIEPKEDSLGDETDDTNEIKLEAEINSEKTDEDLSVINMYISHYMEFKMEIKEEDMWSSDSDLVGGLEDMEMDEDENIYEFEIQTKEPEPKPEPKLEPKPEPDSSEDENDDVQIDTDELYPITIEPEVKIEKIDEDINEIEMCLKRFMDEEFGIKSEIKEEDQTSSNSDMRTEVKEKDLTSSNSDMRTEIKEDDLTSSNSDVSHAAVQLEYIRNLRPSTLNARFQRQLYTGAMRQSTLNARPLRRTYPYSSSSGSSASEPSNVKLLKKRPTSRSVSASTSTSVCKIMKPLIRSAKPKTKSLTAFPNEMLATFSGQVQSSISVKTQLMPSTPVRKNEKQSGSKKIKPQIHSTKPKPEPLTAVPNEIPATFSGQVQSSISVKTQIKPSTPVSKNEKQSTLVGYQLKPISSGIVRVKTSTSTINDDSSTCITSDVNPSACNGARLTLSTVDTSVIKQVKPTTPNIKQVTLVSNSRREQLLTSGPKKLQPSADFEIVQPSTSSAKQMKLSFDSKLLKLSTSNVKQVQPSDDSELEKPPTSGANQVTLASNSSLVKLLTSGPKQVQPSADSEIVQPSTSSAKQIKLSFDSKLLKSSTSNVKQVRPSDGFELEKPSTSGAKQVTLAANSSLVKLLTSGPKQVHPSADSVIVQPSTSSAKQMKLSFDPKLIKSSTSNAKQVRLCFDSKLVKLSDSNSKKVQLSGSKLVKPSPSGAKQVKLLPKPAVNNSIVYIGKPVILQTSAGGSFNALKVNPSLVAKQVKMPILDGEKVMPLVYFTQPVKSSGLAQVGTSHSQPLKPSSSVPTQGKLCSSVATQVESLTPVARPMKPTSDGQMKVSTYDIGQGPSTSKINAIEHNSQNQPSASNQKVVEVSKKGRRLKQVEIRFTKSVKSLEQEERQMKSRANCSLKELLDNYEVNKFETNKSNKIVPYINITREKLLDNYKHYSSKDFFRLYEDIKGSVRSQDPSSPIIPRCKVLGRYKKSDGNSKGVMLKTIDTKKLSFMCSKPYRAYEKVTADCCSKNKFYLASHFNGIRIIDLLVVFYELRGTYHKQSCLIEMAERLFAYLHIKFQHEKLEDELLKGELVQFTKLVVWHNSERSISKLYSPYKPPKYHELTGKEYILKKVTKVKEPRNKNYPFICHVCYVSFRNMSDFAAHFLKSTKEITYLCASCGFLRFSSVCSLIYHILIDRIDGPNTEMCLVCKKPQFSLSEHYATDVEGVGMKCPSCEFLAGSVCTFKIHALNHLENVPFICEACGKSFLHKNLFIDHQKRLCFIKYRKTFYICCFIHFSDEEMFEQHLRSDHIKTYCEPCNLDITDLASAVEHFSQAHSTTNSEQQSLRVYHWCSSCNEYFEKINDDHYLHYHKNRAMCAAVVYKCVCEFMTYYKFKLSHHIENSCGGDDRNVVHRPHILKQCQDCQDLKSYNFIDPFSCESCLMARNEKYKSMAYKCTICRRVFPFSWNRVLDHFFLAHKQISLLHVSSYVSLLEIVENHEKVRVPCLSQITQREYGSVPFNTQYYQKSTQNESRTLPIFTVQAYYLETNNFDGVAKVFQPKPSNIFVPTKIIDKNPNQRNPKQINPKQRKSKQRNPKQINPKQRNKKSIPASGQPSCSVASRPSPSPQFVGTSLNFDLLVNPPNGYPTPQHPSFEPPPPQHPSFEPPPPQLPSFEPPPPQLPSRTPGNRALTTKRTTWYLHPEQCEEL